MAHDCPNCGELCKCDGSEIIQPAPDVCYCDCAADEDAEADLEDDLDDLDGDDEDTFYDELEDD